MTFKKTGKATTLGVITTDDQNKKSESKPEKSDSKLDKKDKK